MKEIEQIKKKILPILKKFNVKKAGIFGSYARGEQKKRSDVDILVKTEEMGMFEFIGLREELRKALKRKVDLVEYEEIRHEIKQNILGDEIPVQI
jgi:predicted nucleotidyltransferase